MCRSSRLHSGWSSPVRHTLRADAGGWAPLHEELLEEMLQIYSLHPQNYYALQVARRVLYVEWHSYTAYSQLALSATTM